MKPVDPHEIARRVIMALVLEPIAEKKGCTTRSTDISKDLRLVDLQGAGVNVGKYFYELAKRVNRVGGQPKLFFDLCLGALRNSTNSLSNKKIINLGLTELLFMVVTSHLAYGGSGKKILQNMRKVLTGSSSQDVQYKEKALELVWGSSRKTQKKDYPKRLGGKNLYEHYERQYKKGKELDFTAHARWCEEVLKSLPITQEMYDVAKENLNKKLTGALEKAYAVGFKKFPKVGIVADYTGVVAYLLLSEKGSAGII